MTYLLDTDWLIDYLDGDPAARALVAALLPAGVAISIITFMEIYEGIVTSTTPHADERAFRAFLEAVTVLPFNRTVARRAATLRAQLRPTHPSVVRRRALDVVIAATALAYHLTFVTRNTDDYRAIPDLTLY